MPEKEKLYVGEQSLRFSQGVYITSAASVVGKKEGEGPLGTCFDMVCEDDKFGEDNWEQAERFAGTEHCHLLWAYRF